MDEQFQFQSLIGGEAPSAAADEAYYSGVCAGLSFRSLLTADFESAAEISPNLLKMPKSEPLFAVEDGGLPPYNFFSEATSSMPSHHHYQLQLPNLHSYEAAPVVNRRSETATYGKEPRRRQVSKLSEKTKRLEKLLPSGKKMDMATVLEEAHKYIKFLQAQISVLESMPRESVVANYGGGIGLPSVGGGDLERLTRQQLLQVVMNSPAAQTQFYSKGFCVYSVEQWLEMEAVRRRKVMFGGSNPSVFLP